MEMGQAPPTPQEARIYSPESQQQAWTSVTKVKWEEDLEEEAVTEAIDDPSARLLLPRQFLRE